MLKELLQPSIKELRHLVDPADPLFDTFLRQTAFILIYSRIDELPEDLLDTLAWQFHIEGWDLARTTEEKRNLIKNAIFIHRHKGTPYAIKKVFESLNLQAELKEWFEYAGEPYHFKVELTSYDRELSPEVIEKLRGLINEYKNVRSWLESIDVAYLTKAFMNCAIGSACELTEYAEMMPYEYLTQCASFACMGLTSEITMYANN